MKSIIMGSVVAILIAVLGAVVLTHFSTPASKAYSTSNVRL